MSISKPKPDFLLFAPKVSYTIYLCTTCRRRAFTIKTIKKNDNDLWLYSLEICGECKDMNKLIGSIIRNNQPNYKMEAVTDSVPCVPKAVEDEVVKMETIPEEI